MAASALRILGERESAFDRESANAEFLWDRVENLRRACRKAAATSLFKRLAEADRQPRFAALKRQAKWQMGE